MKKRIALGFSILVLVAALFLAYTNYWSLYRFFYYRNYARIQEQAPLRWEELTGEDRETQTRYWAKDLDYLLRKLEKKHYDLYHETDSVEFAVMIEDLKTALPGLSPEEVLIAIREIVAAVGDGHTGVSTAEDRLTYPFRLELFAGGYFVVRADRSCAQIMGTRLTAINGIPTEEAIARLAPMVSHDNEVDLLTRSLTFFVYPDYLRWYGLADEEAALFTFTDSRGEKFELSLQPKAKIEDSLSLKKEFPGVKELPVSRNGGLYYWYELLGEERDLYLQYDRCRSDSRNQPLDEFIQEVLALLKDKDVDRVLVDLRYNGGGSSPLLDPLIDGLAGNTRINRPGGLYVAVGRSTYSSAVLNALDLDRKTEALLIGEPTGGAASHYGEVRFLSLPRSGVIIQYSTKFFDRSEYPSGPIQPEIPVVYSFEDFTSGVDPVMTEFLRRTP